MGSCLKKQKFEQEENNMIAVDGLTVEFGGTTLFKDISFQINEKDRIALMGKNGAGKSTLLKIIAGVRNATTNSWNLRRWKIFRNWRRNNNPLFYCFLIKKYFKHKTKSPDVSNKRNISTLFFLSIRKNHSRKILFGKISFRNYQSSRRWFLGMNSLSPCFTPNASYHASM